MLRPLFPSRMATTLVVISFLSACAGQGSNGAFSTVATSTTRAVSGSVSLQVPVLSFNDTGLSVNDGITHNGLWAVESVGNDWEFSMDQGSTWTKGRGSTLEVTGDGAKTIWVRARDNAGNTSEIVRVNCVLDTIPPLAISVTAERQGVTNTLQISGLEPGARWEYALVPHGKWMPGNGRSLSTFGNGLTTVWLRQVDVAGNASEPTALDLSHTNMVVHEASEEPFQPSVLAQGLQTLLIHGVVSRGDSDYVQWTIPKGQHLSSVRLIQFVSETPKAFFALQPNRVFDAGLADSRMLVDGHWGQRDLERNVLTDLPISKLGEGVMTLMVQQNDSQPTQYVIEVMLRSTN